MNLIIRILVIISVIIISELYFYRLLKISFFSDLKKIRLLKIVCVSFPVLFIIYYLIINVIVGFPEDNFIKYRQLFLLLDAFVLIYIPKSLVALILIVVDIARLILKLIIRIANTRIANLKQRLIYRIILVIYLILFAYIIYGFAYEKTNFKVQRVEIFSNKLPENFNGFTIVHISDLHLGSYTDTKAFEKAIKIIKDQNPDLLLITGDLINVSYKELSPFSAYFSSINPAYGKFSILGNHDIGDYFSLKHPKNQEWLTNELINSEKQFGFKLLIDSACYIRKGTDSIAIIGVNNCGNFPFKHSGDLKKAMNNIGSNDFKILLSHDPDHWQNEVVHKTNIDITLSGHTHAMQMAIILGNIHISPSALKYKNWFGLYQIGEQYLYVNPGLGFSGFSGRIGIRPEITLIILHCSN